MKYIILLDIVPVAVIFSNCGSHKEVAAGREVLSAGFCSIETFRNEFDDTRAHCSVWGRSDSLGIESKPQDNKIIESIFM